jgi:hypothetical protein
MPGIIDFSYNWNRKLDCSISFTTIRLRNDNKYKVGEEFYINLKEHKRNTNKGLYRIADIRHFKLNNLNPFVTYLDTGYNVSDCKNLIVTMYKNCTPPINWETQDLSLILLVKKSDK